MSGQPSLLVRLAALEQIIADQAVAVGVSARLLRDRVGLHLPLLYPEQWENAAAERALVERIARVLPADLPRPGSLPRSPRECEVRPLAEAELVALAPHHYLQSHRAGSASLALTWGDDVAALATVVAVDQAPIIELLANEARDSRLVARVWAASWCPANAISYLLSRVGEQQMKLGVRSLVTYVNPNLGYTGASYRAAGWNQIGSEPSRGYAYLDGVYVTVRELATLTHSLDPQVQQARAGSRLRFSTFPLAPLAIYQRTLEHT